MTGFGTGGVSGAADLALVKSGERFLVHCQDWHKREIGILAVLQLGRALAAVGAQGGYVLTAGGFTREACEFARSTRVELISGEMLGAWLRGARPRERGMSAAEKAAPAIARSA